MKRGALASSHQEDDHATKRRSSRGSRLAAAAHGLSPFSDGDVQAKPTPHGGRRSRNMSHKEIVVVSAVETISAQASVRGPPRANACSPAATIATGVHTQKMAAAAADAASGSPRSSPLQSRGEEPLALTVASVLRRKTAEVGLPSLPHHITLANVGLAKLVRCNNFRAHRTRITLPAPEEERRERSQYAKVPASGAFWRCLQIRNHSDVADGGTHGERTVSSSDLRKALSSSRSNSKFDISEAALACLHKQGGSRDRRRQVCRACYGHWCVV